MVRVHNSPPDTGDSLPSFPLLRGSLRRTLADIVEQIKKAASIAALGLVENSWLFRPNLISSHVLDPPSTWVALGIGYGVGIVHKLDHVEHFVSEEDVSVHFTLSNPLIEIAHFLLNFNQ